MKTSISAHQQLTGKTVVITGASSGLGLATAETFAKAGARLILAARGLEGLSMALQRCVALGATAHGIPTDVSDYLQVAELVDNALSLFWAIDIRELGYLIDG